ncbi:hypothetical protein REPUB_Repub09cG0204400 [Reevesia pubescens]
MGKIPPSFRPAIPNSLIKKLPLELQTAIPNQFLDRTTKKKPPQHSKKTQGSLGFRKTEPLFKTPDLSSAKKVFSSIVATTKSSLDLRFHNTLLQSYASISTLKDSVSLFHHMIKTHPSFSPDRSTYHILLSQSCKIPDSSLSPVHQILNLMVNNGFKANQVTTDIAIRSLCEAGRIDQAVELVKELSLKHSPPDSFTFNFLVKNLCKCRTLSTVYGFIDDMKTSFGIKPDLVTYTILIDNVCNSKNLREAMRLVGVLNESGFKPDCFVYNTIMKGYCMLSKGGEAIEVYKKMKEEGIEPDLVTYNTLIFGLSKSGRVKEARKYLDIMVESGHLPDAVTEGRVANAYEVFDYAVESKSLTDVAAYSTLEMAILYIGHTLKRCPPTLQFRQQNLE